MSITHFLEELEKETRFELQLAEHRYIPPVEPKHRKLDVAENLKNILEGQGIHRFWSHQVEAIDLIRQGENVVVMTPTASGKSLIYNIPVIESLMENPETKALYIFPLKGLEQDQVKNLNGLFAALGIGHAPSEKKITSSTPVAFKSLHPPLSKGGQEGITGDTTRTDPHHPARHSASRIHLEPGEVYDGDTTPYRRKKIRETVPSVIFTNPDMLHLAMNPFHTKWEGFFRNLRYVVIDEIHTYRGVFGSHVAHVLRRLRRICRYWGSDPQFIACSATIANPQSLVEELVGMPFKPVLESGSPRSGKHFIFLNPFESPYTEATWLFVQCLKAGLKTIVFTKARKITELIYRWTVDREPGLAEKISPYRAGFLPKERREIEERLFSGELLGVVSTSALELGVDIGGLDACILVGYPGSVSSTWQRAGRVGRHGQESAIFMVGIQDALDQYFMRHPDAFFEKSHEAAVIDTENTNILKKHLPCAASELYLREDDAVYDVKRLRPVIDESVAEGLLSRGRTGDIWFSRKRMPHLDVGIRAIGQPFAILDENGKNIGELSGYRVFREAFPGAVYLHRGRQYRVTDLDLEGKKVFCREADVLYYTQALSKEDTEIMEEKESKELERFTARWGTLRMKNRVTGYEKKNIFDRTRISRHDLEMPEYTFETEGLWIAIDKDTENSIESRGYDLAGSLHGAEHVTIACIPLFALCDKGDIGGLSYTLNPRFKRPAIFIYDGYEGGIGLTKRAFDVIEDWFKAALAIIMECPCEEGCPSCVQDPQCGSGNQPLDKEGAKFLLERWVG
ncbi:MAG: DEAD/DEAH box helicase [Nitrospirae bacterium]|nr:DEAD/DEAH box helicase [Nitrospirota bacterium]